MRPVWEAFEDNLYAHQPAVEAGAMMLYQQDKHDEAAEFLTDYSYGTALRALETGKTDAQQPVDTRVADQHPHEPAGLYRPAHLGRYRLAVHDPLNNGPVKPKLSTYSD